MGVASELVMSMPSCAVNERGGQRGAGRTRGDARMRWRSNGDQKATKSTMAASMGTIVSSVCRLLDEMPARKILSNFVKVKFGGDA